jgi:HPt (histidine-containing phosphotransfer) domain-containing protein
LGRRFKACPFVKCVCSLGPKFRSYDERLKALMGKYRNMANDIDTSKVMQLVQNSVELLERLVDTAVADWEVQLDGLEDACKMSNAEDIHKKIHRILGSVRNFHSQNLNEELSKLEEEVLNNPQSDYSSLPHSLALKLEALEARLRQFISDKKQSS